MKYLILAVTLMPALVFAQEAEPAFIPPNWLADVMLYIQSFPVVGPIILEVMKWVGFIASVMTALSVFAMSVKAAAEKLAKLGFLVQAMQKVIDLIIKALPYLKYFSAMNVQKEELKK